PAPAPPARASGRAAARRWGRSAWSREHEHRLAAVLLDEAIDVLEGVIAPRQQRRDLLLLEQVVERRDLVGEHLAHLRLAQVAQAADHPAGELLAAVE